MSTAQKGVAAVVTVAALVAGLIAAPFSFPQPPPTLSPPGTIDPSCATNVTTALNNWLATVPNGSFVQFSATSGPGGGPACYLINSTVNPMPPTQPLPIQAGVFIQNWNNVTLDGNGATLKQTVYSPQNVNSVQPIMNLHLDTNVLIENINEIGPGDAGGQNNEGDYGFTISGDTNLLITHVSVTNVDGDYYQVWNYNTPDPCGDNNESPLNYGVTISNSSFHNPSGSGYHGATVQAADGFTFSGNTESEGNDIVDFESDSPTFTKWCNGIPYGAGEANITYSHNTFTNVAKPVWLNGQGCTPGWTPPAVCNTFYVKNWSFIANTFNGTATTPGCQCQGGTSDQAGDPSTGLVIQGNVAAGKGYYACSGPPVGCGVWAILGWKNVNIQSNQNYLWNGTPTFLGHTYMPLVTLNNSTNVLIKNNLASGGLEPWTDNTDSTPVWGGHGTIPNTNVTSCQNIYGYNNPDANGIATTVPTLTDGPCP